MNKNIFATVLTGSILSLFAVPALANNLPYSVTGGYAQSKLQVKDEGVDKASRGANLKAGYEFNDTWGIMSSATYTRMTVNDVEFNYTSLAVGPSFRLNDKVSFYVLGGNQWSKAKCQASIDQYCDEKYSQSGLVGALGMQFNPVPQVAIDTSYEYSTSHNIEIATWVIGLGGRF